MARRAPPPHPDGLRDVDRAIWSACAGKSAEIPTVGARVYYFPEGHLEQSSSSTDRSSFSDLARSKPHVCCQITAVKFLAHSVTDEVSVKVSLQPLSGGAVLEGSRRNGDGDVERNGVVAFAKVLTPSDANNGGGFSVPKFCADSIFPPLDFEADPPVQNLCITDVHGGVWKFRHIYRGTPRRHLLTTGWSKFVNGKKLVAGDSVLFMRKGDRTNAELHVGIRRGTRHDDEAAKKWTYEFSKLYGIDIADDDDSNGGTEKSKVDEDGAWNTGNGRISSESIVMAIESAAQGKAFEVVYYPKLGMPDFVVGAEKVEKALNVHWHSGLRVKIAMEHEDSSRMTWFHGTTSSPVHLDKGPWIGSPWRGISVVWDEAETMQHANRVNPWQIEFSCPIPPFEPDFPPPKRVKTTPPSDPAMFTDGTGQLLPLMTKLNDPNTAVQFSPSMLDINYFPAGMQGARHNSAHISSLSNFRNEDNHGMCSDVSYLDKGKAVFITGTNTGSSQTESSSSPESHSTVLSLGHELADIPESSSSPKVGIISFQLFGKTIYANDSAESGISKGGCINDDADNGNKENRGVNGLMELSLTDTCMNLLEKVDAKCQGLSAGDAR